MMVFASESDPGSAFASWSEAVPSNPLGEIGSTAFSFSFSLPFRVSPEARTKTASHPRFEGSVVGPKTFARH